MLAGISGDAVILNHILYLLVGLFAITLLSIVSVIAFSAAEKFGDFVAEKSERGMEGFGLGILVLLLIAAVLLGSYGLGKDVVQWIMETGL